MIITEWEINWGDFVERIKYGFGIEPTVEIEEKENEDKVVSYYSIKSIFWFSTILTAIFGSILMAINLKEKGNKRAFTLVLIFGLLFGICQIVIDITLKNRLFHIASDLIGFFILKVFFWEKYIHPEVNYIQKPIHKPLVIGILIGLIYLFVSPIIEHII